MAKKTAKKRSIQKRPLPKARSEAAIKGWKTRRKNLALLNSQKKLNKSLRKAGGSAVTRTQSKEIARLNKLVAKQDKRIKKLVEKVIEPGDLTPAERLDLDLRVMIGKRARLGAGWTSKQHALFERKRQRYLKLNWESSKQGIREEMERASKRGTIAVRNIAYHWANITGMTAGQIYTLWKSG